METQIENVAKENIFTAIMCFQKLNRKNLFDKNHKKKLKKHNKTNNNNKRANSVQKTEKKKKTTKMITGHSLICNNYNYV